MKLATVRIQPGVLVRSVRGLRDEFLTFYESAYPELVAQLLAITGNASLARNATEATLAKAWRSWPTLRLAPNPLTPTRWSAVVAAAEQEAAGASAPARPVEDTTGEATEAALVVAALQLLPPVQRRALVLHYMGHVSVNELAALSGSSAEHIELLLDDGFTTLAETLDWADDDLHNDVHASGEDVDGGEPEDRDADYGDADSGDDLDLRYDWAAEALADTAARLPDEITAPSPAAMMRRAALIGWSKKAAPVAACAAWVGLAVMVATRPASPAETTPPAIYAQNDSTSPVATSSAPLDEDPSLSPTTMALDPRTGNPTVRLRSVALTSLLDPHPGSAAGTSSGSRSSQGALRSVASSSGASGASGGTAGTSRTSTGGSAPAAGGGTSTTMTTTTTTINTTTTTPRTTPTASGTTPPSSTSTTPPATTTTPPTVTTTTDSTTIDPTTKPVTTDPMTTTDPATTTAPVTTTTSADTTTTAHSDTSNSDTSNSNTSNSDTSSSNSDDTTEAKAKAKAKADSDN